MVNSFVPNLNEVIALASLLDEIGYENEAIVLDNYIEEEFVRVSSSEPYTFVKRAGFWEDVWEKIKGRVGRAVFKDFREAYDDAQKVQDALNQKMDDLNERYKKITHDLKTYQLGDWYKNLSTFEEVGGEEILSNSDFLTSYTKYRDKVIFKNKKQDEKEIDKFYGPKEDEEVEESEEDSKPVQIGEWNAIFDKKNQGVQIHYQDNIVRVKTELWNRWLKGGHFKRVPDPTGEGDIVIMFNVEAKGRIPENLQAALGKDMWKITLMGKDDYVYLGKIEGTQPEETKQKPIEEEKSEEDVFMKAPDLPSKPLESTPIEKEKMVWVRDKATGKFDKRPIKSVDVDLFDIIKRKDNIERLEEAKRKLEVKKQQEELSEPEKIIEETKEASDSISIRRRARLEKILKLSEA